MSDSLNVGDVAPDFTLPSIENDAVRLADFRGKTLVLYFYPKDDTPGCTTEACAFRDLTAAFEAAGAAIVGISPDPVKKHGAFAAKYGLSFPLLADVGSVICQAYGVWKEKSMYGRKYMGVERTTFVIGPDGRIQRVYPKVSVTAHAATVLRDLPSTAR
ncbi:MAG: thioredoxin-dependent thiol peroxidase [Chloroflexota bacterium]|nr:MAG: thioredoxin-dependent thiol peroxidase [Chloroflexota bacterium]